MTMQNSTHPPEERLAALAGGDPDALADDGLRTHFAGCRTCSDVVGDLGALRAALAELPDLAPSRRLQLVPPAPAVPERRAWLGTLRGIAAPVMTVGAALAIVGAVGLGGMASAGLSGAGAAAPEMAADSAAASAAASAAESSGRGALDSASSEPNSYRPGSAQPAPSAAAPGDESSEGTVETLTDTSTPLPWVVLLVGGGALLATGLVLRFAVNPRAG